MRKLLACAALAPCLLASTYASAQVPAKSGVETYAPEFFAAARPYTAMDMINRLPGFTFDSGDSSRGFSGNSGNVLVDGQRPSSKSDSLSTILGRIVASDVDHIEVIHGGAPGIDMQGRSEIANVVRKKGNTSSLVVVAQNNLFADGTNVPVGRAEYSARVGEQAYEASIRRDGNWDSTAMQNHLDVVDANTGTLTRTRIDRSGTGGTLTFNGTVKSPFAGGDFGANLTLSQNYYNNSSLYHYPAAQLFGGNSQGNNGEIGANFQHKLGASTLNIVLLQRLGHSTNLSTSASAGQNQRYSSISDTGESIGRVTLRHPLSDALTVEGGAEAAYNFLRGSSALIQNGAVVSLPSSRVKVEETRGEGFVQASWRMFPSLSFEAGLRTEFSTISQSGDVTNSRFFLYPKPRALLTWDIDDSSQLRARVEQKLGQLGFSSFITSSSLTNNTISAATPNCGLISAGSMKSPMNINSGKRAR